MGIGWGDRPGSIGGHRSLKLKVIDGRVGLANPSIAPGVYAGVLVVLITHIPSLVTNYEVCQLYESYQRTVGLNDALSRDFYELGASPESETD